MAHLEGWGEGENWDADADEHWELEWHENDWHDDDWPEDDWPEEEQTLEAQMARAVFGGNVPKVAELLRDNPDFDVNGRSLLHSAVLYGYEDLAKLVLAHPAIDVNRQNAVGETAISICCTRRSFLGVQLFLDTEKKLDCAQLVFSFT